MVYGTWTAYKQPSATDPDVEHWGSPVALLPFADETKVYIGLTALMLNLLVTVALSLILRAAKVPEGTDQTHPDDYHADADDPRVATQPASTGAAG